MTVQLSVTCTMLVMFIIMDHSEMIIGMLQYCSRDSIEFACVGLKHVANVQTD